MRLVAVGIDGCTGIPQGTYEFDVVIKVSCERVIVVIDEDGIWPTLIGHLEGLDKPVVTGLAATTQTLFYHGVTILVHTDGLVHHVDHGQVIILGFGMVKPVGDGIKTLSCR